MSEEHFFSVFFIAVIGISIIASIKYRKHQCSNVISPTDNTTLYHDQQVAPPASEERIITEEFRRIADKIKEKEPILLITGGAGTGKTTLLDWLIETKTADLAIAFTGVAAVNCKGVTINSFLNLPPQTIFCSDSFNPIREETKSVIKNIHTIIIDEISMVRADLMDAVDRRLKEIRQDIRPFGGIQMVFVGDPYQLPPIITNEDKPYFSLNRPQCQWRSGWFFDAKVFLGTNITHFALTHVFRQKESEKEYIVNLGRARRNRNIENAIQYFNRYCCSAFPAKNVVTITSDNATAARRNQRELAKLSGDIFISCATASGSYISIVRSVLTNNKNGIKDCTNDTKKLPAPYELKIKVGALVMILVNDPLHRYVNGSTGIVRSINHEQEVIMVELTNGSLVGIYKYSWVATRIDWDFELQLPMRSLDGEFIQYPLTLAWAITCHKAQGRTIESVYVEFTKNAFVSGQTYVALSRTTQITNLKLSRPLSKKDFPHDDRLEEWIASLKKSGLSLSASAKTKNG